MVKTVYWLIACLAVSQCGALLAQEKSAVSDLVVAKAAYELNQAKAAHAAAMESARAELISAFKPSIAEAAKTGDLSLVNRIISEREAFEVEGKMPASAGLKRATADYQQQTRKARESLLKAYETAIRQFTKGQSIDKANVAQAELDRLQAQSAGGVRSDGPQAESRLQIIAAFYGQNVSWLDVTDKVRAATKGTASWTTRVDTQDWGDPAPNFRGPRTLLVRYSWNGETKYKAAYQGEELSLP